MTLRKWQFSLGAALAVTAVALLMSCSSKSVDGDLGGPGGPGIGPVTLPPLILDVVPDETCANAGNLITVVGQNLAPPNTAAPTITINGVVATILQIDSDAQFGSTVDTITVLTGAQGGGIPATGLLATVRVTNVNGSHQLLNAIRILPACTGAPVLILSTPNSGSRLGGALVTLQGDNLACVTAVEFVGTMGAGTYAAQVVAVNSDQSIVVRSPVMPVVTTEPFDIVVRTGCGTAVLPGIFTYTGGGGTGNVPDAVAINPISGSALGGYAVRLTGSDLNLATTVRVGTIILTGGVDFFIDATGALVVPSWPASPAGAATTIAVNVTASAGVGLDDPTPVPFTYIGQGAPTCGTLMPASGTQAGGTLVTITGTGLSTVTRVTFGGIAGTSLTHPNATTLIVAAPAYPAAVDVDVVMEVNGVVLPACASIFTYVSTVPPFSVTSITPTSGPQTGGTALTIAGTGLDAVTSITICNAAATIIPPLAPDQVRATSGVFDGTVPQTCDVTVTTAGGLSATLVDGFTYLPVIPDGVAFDAAGSVTAPAAGGTTFRINGANFFGITQVRFSGSQQSPASLACNIQVQGNTQVSGTAPRYFTPGGPFPADVDVVIENAAGADPTPVAMPQKFRYYANPRILSAVGAGGTTVVSAGDLITISGTNFMPQTTSHLSGSVTIRNSGVLAGTTAGQETISVPLTIVNNTTASFSFPPVIVADFYDVTIFTPGAGQLCVDTYSDTLLRPLLASQAPGAASVNPNRGRWDGGTTVVVSGNFSQGVTGVTIGGVGQVIVAQTATSVTIQTRGVVEATAGVPLNVVVSNAAGASPPIVNAYTFIPDPDLTSAETTTPNCGLDSWTPGTPAMPVTQGQVVTVNGTDLLGVNSVLVGVTAATIVSVTDTAVSFAVPAQPTGGPRFDVTLQVVFPRGPTGLQDASFSDTFGAPLEYQNLPSATLLAPVTGAPGTVVTVTGTNLRNVDGSPVSVAFGVVPSASVTPAADGLTLRATVPAGLQGSTVQVTVSTCQGVASAGSYTYPCNAPVISSIAPTSGAIGGGTVVTIMGTDLLSANGAPIVVKFGTVTGVVNVAMSTATSLVVTSPPGTAGQTVDVTVQTCGGTATAAQRFTYGCVAPTITGISPVQGRAGATVTLTGVNLDSPDGTGVAVDFGGVTATVVSSASGTLTVLAPAGVGTVAVNLTNCGGSDTAPFMLTYCAAPTVATLVPTSGAEGSVVTVTGTGLLNVDGTFATVEFGTAGASVISTDPAGTILTASVPAGSGSVNVRVTTCGGSVSAGAFLYCLPPTVTSISPLLGPAGTSVTISGTNLVGADGALPTVTFGGIAAVVTTSSATLVRVTAPAGPAGGVVVSLRTCGGTASASEVFTYCAIPTITGILPTNGPVGRLVDITGTNLTAADGSPAVVTFGAQTAAFVNITPPPAEVLTVMAPAGFAAGTTVTVRARTCGGTAIAAQQFTYSSSTSCVPPVIASISPSGAAVGAQVTLSGSNLVGNDGMPAAVRFGATAAMVVTATGTQLVVTVPAGAGTVAVSATTCGGSASSPTPFTYCAVPTITMLAPATGAADTLVTITGTNMVSANGVATVVLFGTTPAVVVNATAASVTARAPAGLPSGTVVNLTVRTCGGDVVSAGTFTYSASAGCTAPTVSSISPSAGPAGRLLTVTGTNLIGSDAVPGVVRVGGVIAPAVTSTLTTLVVTVPAGAGTVAVSVATCGGMANSATPYTYCTAPTVTVFAPLTGPAGTVVNITGTNFIGADGGATAVAFGTVPATVLNRTATTLSVSAPAGFAPGAAVNINVTTCGGTVASAATYLYPAGGNCTAPSISGIAPTAGAPGRQVTISGSNLVGADALPSVVNFGAAVAPIVSQTATSITVTVPAGAGTVAVTVTTCGGTGTSPAPFTYCTVPTVTSFLPVTGPAGTLVVITGTNFIGADGAATTVLFGTAPAVVVNRTATSITASAPGGIAAGAAVNINVATCGGTAVSAATYLYPVTTTCVAPIVTSIAPTAGAAGSAVTINGSNLVGADGMPTVVQFNGTLAAVVTSTAAQLVVTVPAGTSGAVTVTTCGGTAAGPTPFTYCTAPTITSFLPVTGPAGTLVVITGTNYVGADGGATTALFGTTPATVVNRTATTLTVSAPSGIAPGAAVNISVTTCGGTVVSVAQYTYPLGTACVAPTVTGIAPGSGPAGTQVTITGTNLVGADGMPTGVTFGGAAAALVTSTATQLVVTAPVGAGSVAVVVTTCGGVANAPTPYTYCILPTITSFLPVTGPAGTLVVLTGTNFVGVDGGATTVLFGTAPAVVVNRTATSMTVSAPSGVAPGAAVNLSVITCGGTAVTVGTYLYPVGSACVAPTVTGIAPSSGPAGRQVTITGTNLVGADGMPTVVTFGGVGAALLTSTATSLVVTAPAGAGSVAVVVSTCGGLANSPTLYTYCLVPTTTSFLPVTGPAGTLVVLTGTNYIGADGSATTALFGTTPATVVNRTATSLTLSAPAGIAAGASVNISVTTCGGTVVSAGVYTYPGGATCVSPIVSGIAPSAAAAGAQVTITGTNLVGADGMPSVVTFGAAPATIITATATQIVATVPAGVGSVAVTVTTCGGTASAPSPFTYCLAPTFALVEFAPTLGAAGTVVTLNGTNFVGADGAATTVLFGTTPATVLNRTATTLTVTAPAGIAAGTTVNLTVRTCGGSALSLGTYLYPVGTGCVPPGVATITPSAGSGGNQVVLTGTDLIGADGMPTTVTFVGVGPAVVLTATATRIVVTVPAGAGVRTVTVTTCGGTASAPSPFTYCTAPTLASFLPASGIAGTIVTLTGTNYIGADGGATTVSFGTTPASVLNRTATSLVVVAPAGPPAGAMLNISVTTCGGTVASAATYLYPAGTGCTAPSVTGIVPAAGPNGTQVALTGTNLVGADMLPTTVTFGGTPATVISQTPTRVVVSAPAGPVGSVAVTLSTCGGSGDAPSPYSYCVAPTSGGHSPTNGPDLTEVDIMGMDLLGADGLPPVVTFGSRVATIVSSSATSVVVEAPAGFAPNTTVAVRLRTCGGQMTSGTFTYQASTTCILPTVTLMAPASGPTAGGTLVTLTGTNFIGNDGMLTTVTFGGVPATAIHSITQTQIVAESPAGAGVNTVVVTTCGGSANAPVPFRYCVPPNPTDLDPAAPQFGFIGDGLVIVGTDLVGADLAVPRVRVGTLEAVVVDAQPTRLVVVVPGMLGPPQVPPSGAFVSVTVQTCGGSVSVMGGTPVFTYF